MDSLYDSGLEIARWLQANYPQLTSLLLLVSQLSRFEFYLTLIPLVYWCINKSLGKEIAYLLAISNMLNAIAKQFLREPRPYWLDPTLALSDESSYGIPSGHVQSITVLTIFYAAYVRKRRAWILAGMLISLVAFSRVYLGMHFLHDAAAGFALGTLVLIGYFIWQSKYRVHFCNRLLGQRLLAAALAPTFLALAYTGGLLVLGWPDLGRPWASFMSGAELTAKKDVVAAGGILLGLGIGFILEASRVHFVVDGTVGQRIARYLFGLLVTIAIWRGLGVLFPDTPLLLALPLRLFRYWLAGMWVAYYGPALFVRLGLANASPEPDVQLSISEGGIMRG